MLTPSSSAAPADRPLIRRLDSAFDRAIEAMIATLFLSVVGAPVALILFGWLSGALTL